MAQTWRIRTWNDEAYTNKIPTVIGSKVDEISKLVESEWILGIIWEILGYGILSVLLTLNLGRCEPEATVSKQRSWRRKSLHRKENPVLNIMVPWWCGMSTWNRLCLKAVPFLNFHLCQLINAQFALKQFESDFLIRKKERGGLKNEHWWNIYEPVTF